ncbi:hypothetical protein E3N88_20806 [Mikania micrantha]|uniref:Uncharacterized protein n=1 Tax=Mikania micrantha TaxID=192012 RepID=A0A5N6LH20_9ASTR|nr:hypothetical protein E3N88_42678 [Mikania micrantha]KAD4888733.1 hypothetical protein E3N88_20806 [Mikania micrantha]
MPDAEESATKRSRRLDRQQLEAGSAGYWRLVRPAHGWRLDWPAAVVGIAGNRQKTGGKREAKCREYSTRRPSAALSLKHFHHQQTLAAGPIPITTAP